MCLLNIKQTPIGCLIFRDARLESLLGDLKVKAPKPLKTGTTIAGVVCKVYIYIK